jgi:DNA helicase-2/ATP-dependent DNA helicase PcrA
LNFKRDFPTANIIRLEQNYRSTNSVLKVAYAVIKNNSSRLDKELWTEQSSDEPVQITHYNDSKQEAADVVQKIDFLTNKKFEQKWEYKDNAILLRSSSQTRVFEECLVANSIPYKIIGGVKFYERKEIKDVIAYLRVVISDTDTLAYERLLTYPKRGLGDKAIAEIFNYSGTNAFTVFYALEKLSLSADSEPKTYEVHTDLFGFAVPAKTFKSNIECPISLRSVQKSAILKIVNSIKRWRKSFQDGVKLNELAKAILFDLDYEEALKKDFAEDFQARIDNINELLSSLTGFGDIVEFLEYTTLITDTTDEVSFNEVSIMTLHASKGLEFPVVFLPCWDEGMFPNQRSIDESGEAGLEEERRLAYVGITRARQKLFISHAKLRITYGSLQGSQTSRFIDEIVEHANEFVNVSDNSSDGFYKSSKTRSKSRDTQKETGFYDEFKLPPSYAQKKLENAMPVGAKVMHAKYGKGVIKSRESQFAVVEFDETGSQKTIRTDFLTLLS